MIPRTTINDILGLGAHAPSGDNSQPWRFEVTDEVVDIYNIPEKDNPVLNYRQRGSYVAHGALVENIVLAAENFGNTADVRLFPTPGNETHTARISLSSGATQSSPLADCILRRHTNRRAYENSPLSVTDLAALVECARESSSSRAVTFTFLENEDQKRALARSASSIEQVILENEALHGLLFKDVVWSKEAEAKLRSGMFIKTMEFAPPQEFAFWMASHWRVMRALNGVGLSRFIAGQDAKLYATGAGIGVLLLKGATDSKDFVLAGRAMQRIWLTATSLGLSLQPLAGLIFAAMQLEGGGDDHFSAKHAEIIRTNNQVIRETLQLEASDTVAMMFRLGHAPPPSAVCSKKPPTIEFLST